MSRCYLIVFFAFTSVLLLPDSTALAQSSIIRGVVRDFVGKPIGDASVTAESPNSTRVIESQTNSSGVFSFIGLQRGRWRFTVRKRGYQPVQGFAPVRRAGNSGTISLTMEISLLNPPVASTGLLAGLRADDLQAEIDAAHSLFDSGEYDRAIAAYQIILAQVPTLTSLNIQIGHSYLAKLDYELARSAYQKVPSETLARAEANSALIDLDTLSPSR
jgi:tetratricopeptide (TPR) repeat protein